MTPDQAELLKLGEEGIAAAKLLLGNDHPAFASSRAYYAMFSVAQALLLSKELSFSKHSAVISAFGQHFAKTGILHRHLHRALLTAQEDRLAADYGGGKKITRDEAERNIENAQELLDSAATYLESEAKSGLKDKK